jgi:hypothetical protein
VLKAGDNQVAGSCQIDGDSSQAVKDLTLNIRGKMLILRTPIALTTLHTDCMAAGP